MTPQKLRMRCDLGKELQPGKWAEAPGRGARGGGGGRPSNVLQDRFSNSSNSGVKIAGGGKAYDLGDHNVYEYRFLILPF